MVNYPEIILPNKMENITVKIVGIPYVIGDDICCDVNIWNSSGNFDKSKTDKKRIFVMKMEEKIWKPLYKELLIDYLLKDKIDNDPDLTFLNGMIISIWGTPDLDIYGCVESEVGLLDFGYFGCRKNIPDLPKMYVVKIRHDLEDAEHIGGKLLENAVEREVKNNRLSWKCVGRNIHD